MDRPLHKLIKEQIDSEYQKASSISTKILSWCNNMFVSIQNLYLLYFLMRRQNIYLYGKCYFQYFEGDWHDAKKECLKIMYEADGDNDDVNTQLATYILFEL